MNSKSAFVLTLLCEVIVFSSGNNKNTETNRGLFDLLDREYDFIIIGGGSTGAVIANRLSEISEWRILLVEAGEEPNPLVEVPLFVHMAQNSNYNWNYTMEPDDNSCLGMINGRCPALSGRALGGSSAIDNMIYSRGSPNDFAKWNQLAGSGWSYEEVLPYFMKSEDCNLEGLCSNENHKQGGYQSVSHPFKSELGDAFIEAGLEMGHNLTDYNSENSFGFSRIQSSLKRGRRQSTSSAFLNALRFRFNLYVLDDATATKILIDRKTKIAYGVEIYKRINKYTIRARKEIIVTAGTFNSPKLLMLSGVGPKADLKKLKIPVVKDLPVGQTLYDHITFPGILYRINETLLPRQAVLNPIETFNFLFNGQGFFTSLGGLEGIAFVGSERFYEPEVTEAPQPTTTDMTTEFAGTTTEIPETTTEIFETTTEILETTTEILGTTTEILESTTEEVEPTDRVDGTTTEAIDTTTYVTQVTTDVTEELSEMSEPTQVTTETEVTTRFSEVTTSLTEVTEMTTEINEEMIHISAIAGDTINTTEVTPSSTQAMSSNTTDVTTNRAGLMNNRTDGSSSSTEVAINAAETTTTGTSGATTPSSNTKEEITNASGLTSNTAGTAATTSHATPSEFDLISNMPAVASTTAILDNVAEMNANLEEVIPSVAEVMGNAPQVPSETTTSRAGTNTGGEVTNTTTEGSDAAEITANVAEVMTNSSEISTDSTMVESDANKMGSNFTEVTTDFNNISDTTEAGSDVSEMMGNTTKGSGSIGTPSSVTNMNYHSTGFTTEVNGVTNSLTIVGIDANKVDSNSTEVITDSDNISNTTEGGSSVSKMMGNTIDNIGTPSGVTNTNSYSTRVTTEISEVTPNLNEAGAHGNEVTQIVTEVSIDAAGFIGITPSMIKATTDITQETNITHVVETNTNKMTSNAPQAISTESSSSSNITGGLLGINGFISATTGISDTTSIVNINSYSTKVTTSVDDVTHITNGITTHGTEVTYTATEVTMNASEITHSITEVTTQVTMNMPIVGTDTNEMPSNVIEVVPVQTANTSNSIGETTSINEVMTNTTQVTDINGITPSITEVTSNRSGVSNITPVEATTLPLDVTDSSSSVIAEEISSTEGTTGTFETLNASSIASNINEVTDSFEVTTETSVGTTYEVVEMTYVTQSTDGMTETSKDLEEATTSEIDVTRTPRIVDTPEATENQVELPNTLEEKTQKKKARKSKSYTTKYTLKRKSRQTEGTEQPEIQLTFSAVGSYQYDLGFAWAPSMRLDPTFYDQIFKPIQRDSFWSIFPTLLHPKSKGYMKLRSRNHRDPPLIYGMYYSDIDNEDIETMLTAIRNIQTIAKAKSFKRYDSTLQNLYVPTCEGLLFDSDDYWRCALRVLSVGMYLDQTGTCKMGLSKDKTSVVDNKFKVHGVRKLRVADKSVIPVTLSGQTSATAIMLGERAADMIKSTWTRRL